MKSQPDHAAVLVEAIRGGLAIVVAGTGVSIAATMDPTTGRAHPQASWAGLLEHGVKWLGDRALIDSEVAGAELTLLRKSPQTHRFISAAEEVTSGLGGAQSKLFSEWLQTTVGSISPKDPRILDALDAIRKQGNLLATTNYDDLLLGSNSSQLVPVTWRESDAIVAAVRNRDTSRIIFLHGYWRRPESVILDWKSYEAIARDGAYREDLAAFWKTNIWVYVGCGVNGLSDPDFGLLLERYGQRAAQANQWDYCLVRDDQKQEFQAYFDTRGYNVQAIPFGSNNSQLPDFLRGLLPAPVVATPAPGGEPAATSVKSQRVARIRGLYLKEARRDFDARLSTSIHQARFIDLGIQDDPAAIKPAWGYHDPETRRSYATIADAFAGAERRLLLLGAPGSGKTTALIHLARLLVDEAQRDDQAPIPFVMNLSKFRFGATEGRSLAGGFRHLRRHNGDKWDGEFDRTFEEWLVSEMAEFPELTREQAREWIRDGRLAALLDGLDEFNDDRRADLVRLLNASLLRNYPQMVVVVCSRINEYLPLRNSPDTRLQLRGSVQLEPLSDDQIAGYLEAARAEALREALPNDEALRELARTPLTLSMLVLAYGGVAPSDLPKAGSLSESRHHLFKSYVARMHQRWERRKRNIPFDDSRENDVPVSHYRYDPRQVHRWLSWLALVLSVRMRTTFASQSFHSILSLGIDPLRQSFNFAAVYVTIGVMVALGLTLVALPLVPISWAGALAIAALVVASCSIPPVAASGSRLPFVAGPILVALAAGLLMDLVEVARLVASALPGEMAPSAISVILLAISLVVGVAAGNGFDDDDLWKICGCGLSGLVVAIGLEFSPDTWYSGIVTRSISQAAVMGGSIGLAAAADEEGIANRLAPVGILTAVAVAAHFAASRVPELNWALALAAIGTTILFVVGVAEIGIVVPAVIAYSLLALGGGIAAGYRGAIVGALLFFLLWGLWQALAETNGPDWGMRPLQRTLEGVAKEKIVKPIDALVLSPILWAIAAIGRRFASRRDKFIAFCREGFLLKQSSQEFEFVHRLVRDYFALDALLPTLTVSDKSRRLEAIRLLGYQGESALDVLSEFVENQDPSVRAAALTGLSHISSPIATRCFELHLNDADALVRQALIQGLFKLPEDDGRRLLAELRPLGDGSELDPLLAGLRTNYWRYDTQVYNLIRRLGPETSEMLKQRLRAPNRDVRREALGALAHFYDVSERRLLSEGISGYPPWLDPKRPITRTRIAKCAGKLGVADAVILSQYRNLARDIGLRVDA